MKAVFTAVISDSCGARFRMWHYRDPCDTYCGGNSVRLSLTANKVFSNGIVISLLAANLQGILFIFDVLTAIP